MDGTWGAWERIGGCSVTCGSGLQTERRICTPPLFGGADCVGNDGTNQQLRSQIPCSVAACPGKIFSLSLFFVCLVRVIMK